MPFGQLVIGSPGSGKTTYCYGMYQFLSAIGRKCHVVNLDPANDRTPYPCSLNIRDLVTLDEIMTESELGPNGGIVYALETLEQNIDWLEEGLQGFGQDYILFDCPGQVELFTHHSSLRKIFHKLQKLGYRLVCVHLSDSQYILDPAKYISILLIALRSMLQLDMPHINVLSKIDNLQNYGSQLPFNLDFYTEVQDLSRLLPLLEADPRTKRLAKLNESICEIVNDFSLVGFEVLAVEDKHSMTHLLQVIDRGGGYAFGTAEGAGDSIWSVAMRENWGEFQGSVADIQERWVDSRDEYDEHERKKMEEEEERKQREMEEDDFA